MEFIYKKKPTFIKKQSVRKNFRYPWIKIFYEISPQDDTEKNLFESLCPDKYQCILETKTLSI